MKYSILRITFFAVLFFIPTMIWAQQSDQAPKTEEYCLLEFRPRAGSDRVNAIVDFGKGEEKLLNDEKKKKFESRAAVLNYMSRQNWTLVTSYREDDDFFLIFKRPLASQGTDAKQ